MLIWQIKGLEQAFVFVREIVVVNGQSGNFSVALLDPLVEYCLVLEVSLRHDMNGDVKVRTRGFSRRGRHPANLQVGP